MKTNVLFTAMVLIGLTSANATTFSVMPQDVDNYNTSRYRFAEPIMFIERGVEFLIFPDGSFDFNTNQGNSFSQFNDSYYRNISNTRRGSMNKTQGAPATNSRIYHYGSMNSSMLVQHDFDGKVRRVGNVFINYDRLGKVNRVGTIYMSYNRGGMLSQVGGLRVMYNHWGEVVNSSGFVNPFNSQFNQGFGQFNNNSFVNHSYDYGNSEEFYYYRQGKEIKSQRKIKR